MTDDLDDPALDDRALVDAFVTASRALVGVAVRSIAASPVALTPAQHRALVLVATGRADTVGTLKDHLGINQSNVSRLVDRLHRLGLVRRERSTVDARAVVITATGLGREALEAVTLRRRTEIAAVLAAMEEKDRADALRVMRAFDVAARESGDEGWSVDGLT